MMRIRLPFAGAFLFLTLLAGYAGLSSVQVGETVNDKVVHFVTFFLLTTCFYWILDTSRRRTLNFTLLVCTAGLGLGFEIVQGFLPNGREFDFYDIIANITGSLAGAGICSWYHMRMLERKRLAKNYQVVPGDEDLELGEDLGPQESGITPAIAEPTLDQEVDNWDENVEDDDAWDEDEHATGTESVEGDGLTPSASSADAEIETTKRAD